MKKKINESLKEHYTVDEAKILIDEYLAKYNTSDQKVTLSVDDDKFEIKNSYLVVSRYDRQFVSEILTRTGQTSREYDNLSAEWFGHNVLNTIPALRPSTKDVGLEKVADNRLIVRWGSKLLELLGME